MTFLEAFRVDDSVGWYLKPGQVKRQWMDETEQGFARRCLPMLMANQYGWTIHIDKEIKAAWTGQDYIPGTAVVGEAGRHFGYGIVTFRPPWLFRTPPGWNLLVKGPPNIVKDGIVPLEGLVETDQTAATFTMNWKFTRSTHAIWEPGEAICMIIPVPSVDLLEEFVVTEQSINDVPELKARYQRFLASRTQFNATNVDPKNWQRDYVKGQDVDGAKWDGDHKTNIKLKEF
jgi:hypothetical protein